MTVEQLIGFGHTLFAKLQSLSEALQI